MTTVVDTTVVDTRVIEILRRGRDRVAAGWVQGQSVLRVDPETRHPLWPYRYCATGAIIEPVSHNYDRMTRVAIMLLAQHLPVSIWLRELSSSSGRVVRWNDMPGRTQAEVIDLFDRTLADVMAMVKS